MIIIDLSQIVISNCVVHKLADKNLVKHSAYTSLLAYKKQYGKEFGKLVMACDSGSYWRRDYFPAYKGQRKHSRDASDLDWKMIFEAMDEIKADLKEYFPYRVVEVAGAEADDVIATLCKYTQENDLVQDGLFDGEPEPTIIISADQDFVQLHKYKNVKQWSPMQKKYVKASGSIESYLIEHIITGDSGDNIPNILTPDQWAIDRARGETAMRQKPIKKTFIADFDVKTLNEETKRNYARNKTLIDFDSIPVDLENKIKDAYINYEMRGSKTKLMGYFTTNRMKLLFAELNAF